MIRNLIKQRESLTITLPKEWVKKNDLKNKDPVRLEEDDFTGSIIVSSIDKGTSRPEIRVSIKGFDERNLLNVVNQTYRLGYDRIVLFDVNPELISYVESLADEKLVGFSAQKEGGKVIIESLTQDRPDQNTINSSLRKLFFMIKETFETDELERAKTNMDRTTNYLRRIIIKFNFGGKRSYLYVNMIHKLSLLQHAIYRARKISGRITLHKDVKHYFEEFEQAFWNKDFVLLSTLDKKRRELDSKVDPSKKHSRFLHEELRMIQLCVPEATGIMID